MTSSRHLPYKNNFWNSITYEMSLTRQEYNRTVYGLLDFLGDIGGLFNAIYAVFGAIVAIFSYHGAFN